MTHRGHEGLGADGGGAPALDEHGDLAEARARAELDAAGVRGAVRRGLGEDLGRERGLNSLITLLIRCAVGGVKR